MKKGLALILCAALCFSLLPVSAPAAHAANEAVLPAFPGAEGFGAAATGGRGGEVYHVTSYELTGPGTFHDALTTVGDTPRTIVFEISGELTIPQIIVRGKSNITIAGQTAPGEGVTIRGNNIRFIDCDDIIVRYLRFRMGALDAQDDTMYFENSRNVIIDHSSFSWGTDEVLSILSKDYENPTSSDITVQWSIMSEGLLTHSMGGLIEMTTISMHHNLYAHNNDRNPKTKGQIDFVNNVIYNWGEFPYVAGGESGTKGYGNVEANYFIAGKNSADPQYAVVRGNENYNLYLHNNRIDSNKNGELDGTDTGPDMMETARPSLLVPERFNYPPVHTQDPETAYEHVLNHAGSSLYRDGVDERIIGDVRNQTGVIIGHEDDVGGFPELASATGPVDTDRDGMPDEWELAHGLDPLDPEDRNHDMTGDGYTNLEKYLHELAEPGFPEQYPMTPLAWTGDPFEPPVIPEPEVPAPALPVMDGEWVRNAVIHDNSTAGSANAELWSIQSDLQVGDYVASDRMTGNRAYRIVSLPEEVAGTEWIRSPVASRSASNPDLLSFWLVADTDVYIAHDARITELPEWLSSDYEDTGLTIVDDQPITFKLYKQRASSGTRIVTGPNNGTSRMNYFVILKPADPEGAVPEKAPTSLQGELAAADTVALDWTPVDGADRYLIYRASSKDEAFRAVAAPGTAVYEDQDIEQGITYTYKVTALGVGGESAASEAVAVPTYDASQPAPPAPAGLEAARTGSISVELAWQPVDEALSYTIYRAEAGGEEQRIGSASATRFTDTDVEPSTAYTYRVTATGAGGESEHSEQIGVTTNPPVTLPEVPAGLSAGEVTPGAFGLEWPAVEGADSYVIYRKAESEAAFAKIGESDVPAYEDRQVSLGQASYRYQVAAVNEMGETAPSADIEIEMPVPGTPQDLFVGLSGDSFVGLIWTAGGGAVEVRIYRESDGVTEQVGTAKVNTFYDRSVEPGVEYTYSIKGSNAGGESEASNTVRVTPGVEEPDPEVPGAPTDIRAQAGNGTAEIRFTAPEEAGSSEITGYEVTVWLKAKPYVGLKRRPVRLRYPV
ncbi:fibronectin type III domain-containing protein [Paenibacillus sp. 1P07SE]|uniref:fibronectin type III domain-containing protein n=1 Tax=Paenibacillus sp. 1P07SE TaxID=3132209 RepID=UPI0039A63F9F